MTDPLVPPSRAQLPARSRRRLAALAAAGLAGVALAPALAMLPAAAATSCVAPRFTAAATADLVRLDALDLRALGRPGALANVRIASSTAGVTGGASANSAARARFLDAKLLDLPVPTGALAASAQQAAPPAAGAEVTARATAINLGLLALGTGTLTAHTPWPGPESCAPAVGTVAHASAALHDATVLPGSGDGHGVIQVPRNLASDTVASLVDRHPQAVASASLTDFTLFAGTPGTVRVQVVSQPRLRVLAAGSVAKAVVEYTAPVLTIQRPNGASQTLDSPTRSIEIAVPASAGGHSASGGGSAGPSGPAAGGGLPVLGALLGGLPLPVGGSTGAGGTAGNGPDLSGLGAQAVVRLSLGELHKHVTAEQVSADADALRVQVVTRTSKTESGAGGYGGGGYGGGMGGVSGGGTGGVSGETTLVDVGVGVLGAEAGQPAGGGGVTGGGGGTGGGPTPTPTGGPIEAGTPGGGAGGGSAQPAGKLPLTGGGIAAILSGGTVLVVAGRFLMLMARRRLLG